MKAGIHPAYEEVNVVCACGHTFRTRTAHKGDIRVEICSNCHPFFTGRQKLIDTEGRVDRFQKKYPKAREKNEKKQPSLWLKASGEGSKAGVRTVPRTLFLPLFVLLAHSVILRLLIRRKNRARLSRLLLVDLLIRRLHLLPRFFHPRASLIHDRIQSQPPADPSALVATGTRR